MTVAAVAMLEPSTRRQLAGPVIDFSGVTKRYGATLALDNASFAIQPGEMVALLGPNGAGKSTAVDIMLGLRRPDAGSVRVIGREPLQANAEGRVGAMLQTGGLPARATAGEVVDLARHLYGCRRGMRELLAEAGLAELAGRRVDQLSGGQAQRVRLAVALAGSPEVLFLDEPTVGLDAGARRRFWADVHRVAEGGAAVLFTTHYLEEADASAERVLVLASGSVIADGPPAAIKAQLSGRLVRATLSAIQLDELRRLPGVIVADALGHEVTLRTSDPDATVAALYRSGVTVANLQVSGASLEDALISLTTPTAAQS